MVGKANIVFLIFSEAAPGRSSRGGVLDFAPGGFPVIDRCFQRPSGQMCQQAAGPESLQCRQMPWAACRMVRPFMALQLGSGAVPEWQGHVPQPESFPLKPL